MSNVLWSLGTTVRNPERIPGFFKTICELEGETWNHDTQKRFQILLIKNRFYVPGPDKLNENQIEILENNNYQMSEEEARDIFESKRYKDAPIRGRTSFDPLEKIGLACVVNGRIRITEIGSKFKNGEIEFGDVFFNAFLKQQYPCPLTRDNRNGYDIKPFIGVLHLIKLVNEKWQNLGNEPVGISKEEFGIFCLNIKNYSLIPSIADELIRFRQLVRSISGQSQRRELIKVYTEQHLSEYENLDKKLKDYRDNMIRCLRLTKLIFIRGNGFFLDLEPRRYVEINKLLETDNASSRRFTKEEWVEYIGSPDSYVLPWETETSLVQIQLDIIKDIRALENYLKLKKGNYIFQTDLLQANRNIAFLRSERSRLENEKNKIVYSELDKAIQAVTNYDLERIRNNEINRPSVELERSTALALTVMDDAIRIKPNYPVGDDNEPTFTAPGDVPDIECYYTNFNLVCEVTMMTGRGQWVSEGQPVMRHLRDFEDKNGGKENYCLFIAPSIHEDTINTFWNSVKYNYEGKRQKIVPITIAQMKEILNFVLFLREDGRDFSNRDFKSFLDRCSNVTDIENSIDWKKKISRRLRNWIEELQ